MKTLRQVHLYLGCLFAPMILYFAVSGAWQVFRLNNVPKDEPTSALHSFLHELSKPHTSSTLPGLSPRTESSEPARWFALLMAVGLAATTLIGIVLALRFTKSLRLVTLCLVLGLALPIGLLLLHASS